MNFFQQPANGLVLATGIWQLATANDLALILDLWEHIGAQDVQVMAKPVIHLKDRSLLRKLPAQLQREAILWEGLKYNVTIQAGLCDAIINAHDADWIWQIDSDERTDFDVEGGLRRVIKLAERAQADYVPGHWIDRIARKNALPAISATDDLAKLFPIPALLTKHFQGSIDQKVALHRRTCPTGGANHQPLDKTKRATRFRVPIWHFKWNSDLREQQAVKVAADGHQPWIGQWQQTIERLEECEGNMRGPWGNLPKEAWPRLPRRYNKGRYPCQQMGGEARSKNGPVERLD